MARRMLGILTVVAFVIHGLAAPRNEVALNEISVTQDTVAQSRAELARLTSSLLDLQEKKAEEEGELEVLQAQEKELTEQVHQLKTKAPKGSQKAVSFLQVSPSKEADALAELEMLRAERHAREAKESAALARYAYEKLAESQSMAAESAGDAALKEVIADARQDASNALKISGSETQAAVPALSFLQELDSTDAQHVALKRAQASLAKMHSSALMSREQLLETNHELQKVQDQIDALQRKQATMKKEASTKEKLLKRSQQILAAPVAAEADAVGLGVFTQLGSQGRSGGKAEQKLASAEQALAAQKAALEQKRHGLALVQSELRELQQAAAKLREGDVAKVKTQNVALLETLRSTSRADKAARVEAEAESEHLKSAMAAKEQQLMRQRQDLDAQHARVAALHRELSQQRSHKEQMELQVNRKMRLLSGAQEQLQSTEEAISDLKREEAASSFDLTVLKEEQLGSATQQLKLADLHLARLQRQQRTEALEKEVAARSKNISDLSFVLEQEKSHPLLQELRKKTNEAATALKEKASTARTSIGLLQQQVAQQSSQLRATYRSKFLAAQAQKQQALETLEAKLEAETHEQLTALEAKNRPLSHQLVLLQQEDEAQVEVLRHKATARALHKNLEKAKSEEAQLLDKAQRAALKTEAQLQEQQKALERELHQKEQSILNLQQQRLEDGQQIQALQLETAQASSEEKRLATQLRQTEEQRARLVSSQEVHVSLELQKLSKAEQEEQKRMVEERQGLQRELEAQVAKNHFEASRKAAQLQREIHQVPSEDGEITELAAALKDKEAKLQKVRDFLTSENGLSSAAKVELKNLREHRQQ